MQVCKSLQTDNHASTPSLRFLQAGCPSCRPTNSVKALKANEISNEIPHSKIIYRLQNILKPDVHPYVPQQCDCIIMAKGVHIIKQSVLIGSPGTLKVDALVEGSKANHMNVNWKKTKEMVLGTT